MQLVYRTTIDHNDRVQHLAHILENHLVTAHQRIQPGWRYIDLLVSDKNYEKAARLVANNRKDD